MTTVAVTSGTRAVRGRTRCCRPGAAGPRPVESASFFRPIHADDARLRPCPRNDGGAAGPPLGRARSARDRGAVRRAARDLRAGRLSRRRVCGRLGPARPWRDDAQAGARRPRARSAHAPADRRRARDRHRQRLPDGLPREARARSHQPRSPRRTRRRRACAPRAARHRERPHRSRRRARVDRVDRSPFRRHLRQRGGRRDPAALRSVCSAGKAGSPPRGRSPRSRRSGYVRAGAGMRGSLAGSKCRCWSRPRKSVRPACGPAGQRPASFPPIGQDRRSSCREHRERRI